MCYTPRQRVEIALRKEYPGTIPFTMYEYKIKPSALERELRNRGLCIVNRTVPVCRTVYNDVKITKCGYYDETGRYLEKTVWSTPVGEVSTLVQPAGFTSWYHEKWFKSKDDYKVIKFIVENEHYIPDFTPWIEAEAAAGGDIIFRAAIGLEPLQSFISSNLMDMQDFCYEWMDSRDEILDIVAIIRRKRLEVAQIIADSPALHANYGGNVTPEIIGREVFDEYYVPCYNEVADIFHKKGKLLGCHFDANNKLIADSIARSELDYVEAFTPAPDTDMSLEDGRRIWKNKVLWLNFPSSLHLKSDEDVEQATVEMFQNMNDKSGIIMGITEDIPPERGLFSCRAIMNGLAAVCGQ